MTHPLTQPETQAVPAADDAPMPERWTEDQVSGALYRHFGAAGWAAIGQVTTSHDADTFDPTDALYRRADMLLVRRDTRARSELLETFAIEVKVSRADFLADVANPAKQRLWRDSATRVAYAVPAGLVKDSEVPEGFGLIEVLRLVPGRDTSPTEVRTVRAAPYRDGHTPHLIASTLLTLLHRTAAAEAKANGWVDPTLNGSEADLRAQLAAERRRSHKAELAAENALGKADAWRAAFASATDGLPCRWCGRALKPLRARKGQFGAWKHTDAADEAPCAALEELWRTTEAHRAYNTANQATRDRQVRARMRVHVLREQFDYDNEPWRAFYDLNANPPEPDPGL